MSSKESSKIAKRVEDDDGGSSTVTIFSEATHETVDTLVSTEYTGAEEESMSISFSLRVTSIMPSCQTTKILGLNNFIFHQLQLLKKKRNERSEKRRRQGRMPC